MEVAVVVAGFAADVVDVAAWLVVAEVFASPFERFDGAFPAGGPVVD